MTRLGDLLQGEADRRGITHDDAAQICDVSQATFSRWVNGDNPPGPRHIPALARYLRKPRDEVTKLVSIERDSRRSRSVAARLDGMDERLKRIEAALEGRRR